MTIQESVAPSFMMPQAMESKSATAFRTISEVSTNLAVPQHVLRFWESKFQQIRPLKRGGGRRYYRPEDVHLISSIKEMLYGQGFTIRGVQKLLKEKNRPVPTGQDSTEPQIPDSIAPLQELSLQPVRNFSADKRREIEDVLAELKSLRELLKQTGI